MISKIELQGFQGHKHSVLDLHEGFNVIIGRSDAGKTSILRAVRLVMDNRPLGLSGWVHRGQTALSAKLTLDDGSVERKVAFRMVKGMLKDAIENIYIVDGQTLSAPGTDVPIPVRERLNLHPINIQRQHDGPFLVGETGGAVARYINEVVNLEVMDSSMANIASTKRDNDQKIRVAEVRLARLNAELEQFPDLESTEVFIASLEEMSVRLDKVRADKAVIEGALAKLVAIEASLPTLPPGLDERLAVLEEQQVRQGQVRFTAEGLAALLNNLTVMDTQAQQHKGVLLILSDERLTGLTEAQGRLEAIRRDRTGVGLLLSQLYNLENMIPAALALMQRHEKELKDNFGDVCPLCERMMGDGNDY